MTEHEMVGWHDFEPTPGDCRGQRSLACYSLWGGRAGYDLAIKQQSGRNLEKINLIFNIINKSLKQKNFLKFIKWKIYQKNKSALSQKSLTDGKSERLTQRGN